MMEEIRPNFIYAAGFAFHERCMGDYAYMDLQSLRFFSSIKEAYSYFNLMETKREKSGYKLHRQLKIFKYNILKHNYGVYEQFVDYSTSDFRPDIDHNFIWYTLNDRIAYDHLSIFPDIKGKIPKLYYKNADYYEDLIEFDDKPLLESGRRYDLQHIVSINLYPEPNNILLEKYENLWSLSLE